MPRSTMRVQSIYKDRYMEVLMETIRHQVGIEGTVEQVTTAITTTEGLANWWTTDTRGSTGGGEEIEFYFGEFKMAMKVQITPPSQVRWRCVAGDAQWIDTEISFKLRQDGRQTIVDFEHGNWATATPLHSLCSTKWAVYLLSLKDFIETGKGGPFPNDIQINHSE